MAPYNLPVEWGQASRQILEGMLLDLLLATVRVPRPDRGRVCDEPADPCLRGVMA